MDPQRHEVIVVGGGQAGLAIGYFLSRQGRDFTILEAADTPAAAWRNRWESPRLFTPVRYDSLPGRPLPGDPVLVVGGGNTGYQIAAELASSREVHLSIGTPQTPLPQRILGRDLFWYLDATGLIRKTAATRIGRRMRAKEDTLIGSSPRALRRHHGVEFHGRTVDADGSTLRFSDDTTLDVRSVIWATGFGIDHSWVDAPVFDEQGLVLHRRGVTDLPGLYFLGLPWQHTRGSALLGFVKDDAAYLAGLITSHARAATAAASRPAPQGSA